VTLRFVSVGATIVAAAGLLTACDKPQPTITAFAGSTSKTIAAQPECVFTGQCTVDSAKIGQLEVMPGSDILVDVPKSLARAGWIVTAFTQDSTGKNSPIDGAGSSTTNHHSVRVRVPQATGGYLLQVSPPAPSKRTQDDRLTTWIIRVQLTQ
jgi:hypothetical protein